MCGTGWVNFPFSTPGVRNTAGWGRLHLLVIYTIQHFLVKLLPRDTVPSRYVVKKITEVWEEGRTCVDRIPDTSCTNLRHLLAWAGNQAVVS
jgi:hypothetical protein